MKTKTSQKNNAINWLSERFKPEECFLVGNIWFGIIPQDENKSGYMTYAIKRVDITKCEFAPDEGEWLSWPEKRYETLGGARNAILLNYEL
jgi:hypothetical protein